MRNHGTKKDKNKVVKGKLKEKDEKKKKGKEIKKIERKRKIRGKQEKIIKK